MGLPTDFQDYIHLSRYSRWLETERRRETWEETVARYFAFFDQHLKEKLNQEVDPITFDELYKSVVNLEVMPSMRCLMTAGRALKRDHAAGYNCSMRAVDDMRAFDEALYILMCGCGLGFSVERQFVNKLPVVPESFERSETVIVVRDSKRGWAEGLRELIALLYSGRVPSWDLSKLRPAGARLKTMGGRSSGPDPLNNLFHSIVRVFTEAAGRKLTSVECHDIMCMIGDTVIVGGVRRSALLSLSNLSDQRMRDAKSGRWWETEPWRALANNSVAYTERPEVGQFMQEWLSLYTSKSGERGIFNRQAVTKQVLSNGRRKAYWDDNGKDPIEFGTNPCVSGDTLVLTNEGYFRIDTLVGKKVNIWNGEQWSEVEPFSTGVNPTLKVILSDGTELRTTQYHEFLVWSGWSKGGKETRVHAMSLNVGDKLSKYAMPVIDDGYALENDAYTQGFYSGDGNEGLNFSWLYEPKYVCINRLTGSFHDDGHRLRKRWNHGFLKDRSFVPINTNISYRLNWLAGLLDSDGVVTSDKNGQGFQIASINKQFLIDVKLMLTTMGVRSKVVKGRQAGQYMMPDGKGGQYLCNCAEIWRLLIGNTDGVLLMNQGLVLNRLKHNGNSPQRDARQFVKVLSVEADEPCETFCFNEPQTHRGTFNGVVTGQCSEIILRSKGFCNLTEVVVRAQDSYDDLARKVEVATILGTWQSTLTDFRYLTKGWENNALEERLLGVSLTGIMDHKLLGCVSNETKDFLSSLKEVAVRANREYAEHLGISQSVAVTTVKPSGTVSSLVNSAAGIHPRHAPFYIRRVRQDVKDPLTEFMMASGFIYEPDVMKDNHVVFSFPMRSPLGAVCRDNVSAIQQLEHWLMVQDHWCEHKPSITVTVREDEWPEVGGWVWKHFDSMSGVSFLPHSDHIYRQAPYEAVTEDVVNDLESKMPRNIDWSGLSQFEKEDTTTGTQELACVSGVCEVN